MAFEPLCELQFDKAAQEISSPYTGWWAVAPSGWLHGDAVAFGALHVACH